MPIGMQIIPLERRQSPAKPSASGKRGEAQSRSQYQRRTPRKCSPYPPNYSWLIVRLFDWLLLSPSSKEVGCSLFFDRLRIGGHFLDVFSAEWTLRCSRKQVQHQRAHSHQFSEQDLACFFLCLAAASLRQSCITQPFSDFLSHAGSRRFHLAELRLGQPSSDRPSPSRFVGG